MAGGDFYRRVGYTLQHKFDYSEFENVAKNAEKIYRADAAHWREHLCSLIDHAAAMAQRLQRPRFVQSSKSLHVGTRKMVNYAWPG